MMMNTNNMRTFLILVALLVIDVVNGYAKIADEMTCANGDCSETISHGSAKIGYRPKDKTFLNMKKGDTVLVKAKNAGVKTNLWAGQVVGNNHFGFFPSTFIKETMVMHKKPSKIVKTKPFLKGSKEDENKKSIMTGGQKLIIEKPAVKPAPKRQHQQQIDNADDDPEKAVKVVDNSNDNKPRNDDNTDEEKFDSRKDAIVKNFQNFQQESSDEEEESTIKTVADETASAQSQVSTVDDIQTVGDKQQDSVKQDESEPADLIKKLINSTSPSKEKSDERIQMFLDLVAPNSIEGKEVGENDRNYLIKQNMKAKVVQEENENGDGDRAEVVQADENIKAQVVQERQEDENVRDEEAKVVQEVERDEDGSETNVGENLVVVTNDETTHNQQDNQMDIQQQNENNSEQENQDDKNEEQIQRENNNNNDQENQDDKNEEQIQSENNNNNEQENQDDKNEEQIQNENNNSNEQENQDDKNEEQNQMQNIGHDSENDQITENGAVDGQQNNQFENNQNSIQQTHDEDIHKTETNAKEESNEGQQSSTNVITDTDDERRRTHQHPLAFYFQHGRTISPRNHMTMTSQRLTWKTRDDMKSKLADEELVAYFLPGRGDRSIASDYDDDGNAVWEEEWDEEDEWAEEEEEEGISTDELVLLTNKRRLLEDRENILNVETHEQQARIRSKLASVIDLMKEFSADLNTDIKYKATQEIREIKSDFELLEKRLRLIGTPEPSVNLEDDEGANYTELNEMLERRSAVIKEKEDSLVDARRFGGDLIDAADDIETAIRRDRDESVGYKQVIDKLEKELDERHASDEQKIIEMEKDAGETQTKLDELQQQMQYEGTDELQQAATVLKHRLKSLETAVDERRRKEDDMMAPNTASNDQLNDRVSMMEKKLRERKAEEENLIQVQEEASALKQQFQEINQKFSALLEDRALQDRITSLEEELRERKLNETQKAHATQQTISELMGKVADLEEGKYDTQHSSELKTLKSQLESLMTEMKGGNSEENTNEDKQQQQQETNIKLQERVDLLERQLLEEKKKQSEQSDGVFDDVSKRLKDLEAYVNSKEQEAPTTNDGSRLLTAGIGKDEIVKVLREVASDKGSMLRLVATNQQPDEQQQQQDLMESIVAATDDDDDVSDDVDEKKDEVNIPTQAEETIGNAQTSGYIDLHEGKFVDWDESVEGKPREAVTSSPTASTWDETIGGDDEEENSQDNEEKEEVEEIKEDEKQQENEKQIEQSKESGQEETKQLDTAIIEPIEIKQPEIQHEQIKPQQEIKQEENRQTERKFKDPTAIGEQVEVPVEDMESFAETNDTKTDEKHESRRSIDNNDVQPPDSTRKPEQTHNQFLNDPFAHMDARPPTIVEEVKIEGMMVELMYLLVQFPSDVKYILEPLAVYWFSLLPDEYQHDFYGFSWSVVFISVSSLIVITTLLNCYSNSKRRRQRDLHQSAQLAELQAQIKSIVEEKLTKERELTEISTKLQQNDEVFQKENSKFQDLQNKMKNLEKNLKEVEKENRGKQTNLDEANKKLKQLEKNHEQLQTKGKESQKQLEKKDKVLNEVETSNSELKKELKKVQSDLKKQQHQSNQDEKEKTKKETLLKNMKEENSKFKKELEELKQSTGKKEKEIKEVTEEKDHLKDCLLQFKGVQEALAEEGDDELDSDELVEKQKAKLDGLLDCARVQTILTEKEKEMNRLVVEIKNGQQVHEDNEVKIAKMAADLENLKTLKAKEEQNRTIAEAKLEALTSYYSQREVDMQGKLGQEKTELAMIQTRLADKEDSSAQLLEQLTTYRKMNEDAKREYNESEKQRKNEINLYEKKAHDNWLASRESERKLDEATRELTSLRMEFSALQQRLSEMEEFEQRCPPIIRPRPMPSGPIPRAFSRPVPSPHPSRSGADSSPRNTPLLRRPRSPNDSIPDMSADHGSQRSSRPPSQPNFPGEYPQFGPPRGPHPHMMHPSDHMGPGPIPHRPPSVDMGHHMRGPTPIRDGPPPMRRGDGPPPPMDMGPPPMRDGPPRMRDEPPHMRGGQPPMDIGPPSLRDGPPMGPMRDGPPMGPMRDGPHMGPMRDGPHMGPMRDGPHMGPMRDGPHMGPPPMRDGPHMGPMRDGPPMGPPPPHMDMGPSPFPPQMNNGPPPPHMMGDNGPKTSSPIDRPPRTSYPSGHRR